METRTLGKSGIRVPVIGMGTWRTFDVRTRAAQRARRELVDAALAAGITVYDSSPMYGEAERVLGLALTGRRDAAFVATKVWTDSEAEARAQIAAARGFFGDRIDLYQVHNLVAWPTVLPLLEEGKAAGWAGLIGATHYDPAAFPEMMALMRTGRLDTIQVPYNALDRGAGREVLPLAAELGLGVVVMRPFGAGDLVQRVPRPAELAPFERFGVFTWGQALLKWVLSDPRVTVVIPATRRPGHAAENEAAGSPPWFDEETRERISYLTGYRK